MKQKIHKNPKHPSSGISISTITMQLTHRVSFHAPGGTTAMFSHGHTFVTWYEVTLSGLIETISHDKLASGLQISIPKPNIGVDMGVWYLSAQPKMSPEKNLTAPFSLFQFSYLMKESWEVWQWKHFFISSSIQAPLFGMEHLSHCDISFEISF